MSLLRFFLLDSLILKVPTGLIGETTGDDSGKWSPPVLPLTISDSYRCWKYEVEHKVGGVVFVCLFLHVQCKFSWFLLQILAFRSLGPKNYSLTYFNEKSGKVESMVKVRGFSLRSAQNCKMISVDVMKDYIDSLLRGEKRVTVIGQWQIRIDPSNRQLYTTICGKKFGNSPITKRVLCRQPADPAESRIYVTFPFGYTNVLETLVKNDSFL